MPEIPYGYCQCGCGEKTQLIKANQKGRVGRIGIPRQVIKKHHALLEVLFWAKVDKTGDCWEWTGGKGNARHGKPYGQMCVKGKTTRAHRISWLIHNGPVPEGLCVLHKCDNPGCVNPAHLFLGTHADNMADMASKKRAVSLGRPGESHPLSKLAISEVLEIRKIGRSETPANLAVKYKVSRSLIYQIRGGVGWNKAIEKGGSR